MARDGGSIFGPLTNRMFRRLWSAMIFANLGNLVQTVAAGWTMMQLTESPTMVALVQTASSLPVMLFSVAAGVWPTAMTAAASCWPRRW